MTDDRNRVTVADWNTYFKSIIPPVGDMSKTPTFGYIVDEFRKLYGIYVSVTPSTKSELTNDDKIVYNYREEVYKLNGNNVVIHWSGSNQAFYLAMREALRKASEFVDD